MIKKYFLSTGANFKKFLFSDYGINIMHVFTGTAIAQLLPILSSPILSRIYSPQDFAYLGILMSVSNILTVPSTGRYEYAIILPEDDQDSLTLVVLSSLMSISAFFVIVAGLFVSKSLLLNFLEIGDYTTWIFFIASYTLFVSSYQILNFWYIKKNLYKSLSFNRVIRSIFTTVLCISFGFVDSFDHGLIWGTILGQFFSTAIMLKNIYGFEKKNLKNISVKKIIAIAIRYKDFPRFSVPSSFLNITTQQMPIFVMMMFLNKFIIGQYTMAQRMLAAPISTIATAIGDVFQQTAREEYINNGNCKKIWLSTFNQLAMISIPIFATILMYGPEIFGFIFGAEWVQAGEIAQILAPFACFQFIFSTLSRTIIITEHQKFDFIWQVSLFILITAALFIGGYNRDAFQMLFVYSILYFMMYIINGWYSYKYAKNTNQPNIVK